MAGKLRRSGGLWPAVGDWVFGIPTRRLDSHCGGSTAHSVLQRRDPGMARRRFSPRMSTFADRDVGQSDLNLNRLDRYVAMALAGAFIL